MKWYWRIFPWLMFDHYKAKADQYVTEQKESAAIQLAAAEKRLKELTKGNFLIQPECVMEFAFTAGNGNNWKFVDERNMPAQRAMYALDVYDKLNQKTDYDYHKLSYKAIYDQARAGNLIMVGQIAENALQRINHLVNADILMELASVLYIDENENPYEYDTEYAEKKIALWRKEGLESFFSRTPLKDYLPSFDGLSMNFQTYTEAQRKELVFHLKSHLSMLSSDPKNSEIKTSTTLVINKLNQLIGSKS